MKRSNVLLRSAARTCCCTRVERCLDIDDTPCRMVRLGIWNVSVWLMFQLSKLGNLRSVKIRSFDSEMFLHCEMQKRRSTLYLAHVYRCTDVIKIEFHEIRVFPLYSAKYVLSINLVIYIYLYLYFILIIFMYIIFIYNVFIYNIIIIILIILIKYTYIYTNTFIIYLCII